MLFRSGAKCVSGAWQRRLQYDRLHRPSALCSAAGGLAFFLKRQCGSDLVVLSHCGAGKSGPEYLLSDPDRSKRDPADLICYGIPVSGRKPGYRDKFCLLPVS